MVYHAPKHSLHDVQIYPPDIPSVPSPGYWMTFTFLYNFRKNEKKTLRVRRGENSTL